MASVATRWSCGIEVIARTEELAELYDSVGMRLANTFAGSGKARKPKPSQFEIFVEGRK